MRRLRRIEAINGKIRNLTKERDEAEKMIKDLLPIHEGDQFAYNSDYLGILAAAWVGYDPAIGKASIDMEYQDDDGQTIVKCNINPKLLKRVSRRRCKRK